MIYGRSEDKTTFTKSFRVTLLHISLMWLGNNKPLHRNTCRAAFGRPAHTYPKHTHGKTTTNNRRPQRKNLPRAPEAQTATAAVVALPCSSAFANWSVVYLPVAMGVPRRTGVSCFVVKVVARLLFPWLPFRVRCYCSNQLAVAGRMRNLPVCVKNASKENTCILLLRVFVSD